MCLKVDKEATEKFKQDCADKITVYKILKDDLKAPLYEFQYEYNIKYKIETRLYYDYDNVVYENGFHSCLTLENAKIYLEAMKKHYSYSDKKVNLKIFKCSVDKEDIVAVGDSMRLLSYGGQDLYPYKNSLVAKAITILEPLEQGESV